MKTYQHPNTKEIRTVADDADIQIAALKKLGYKRLTVEDIENDPRLSVTYEQVTNPKLPDTPPALPRLTTPVPDAPTRDTSKTVQPTTGKAVTREDVEPLTTDKGKESK